MRRLRKVRDPLYGYVYLSELENRMISHPLLLRLHYLHQNGTAFLTYPSAHPMRFGHSLGAMHVAGQLVVAALINATPDVDDCLITSISKILEKSDFGRGRKAKEILEMLCEDTKAITKLRDDGLYRLNHFDRDLEQWPQMVRLLLYQGVRLACLVHDLGHPPFSHTTESAFQQAFSTGPNRYSNHEAVGARILTTIVDDLVREETMSNFAHAALALANELSKKDGTSPLKGIAQIVSSEDVDADRVDYVRRDTLTAGLAANSYDLGRLLDAATFRVDSARTIQLIYTTDALSMLEAFFQARFHLYRWMLWHHNVLRINLALSRATYLLMTAADDCLPPDVVARRNVIREVSCLQKGPAAYAGFDDNTFFADLGNILKSLEETKRAKGDLHLVAEQLYRLLRVFIRRETSLLPALWKRPDAYFHFADAVITELKRHDRSFDRKSIPAFNSLLNEWMKRSVAKAGGRGPNATLSMCQEIEAVLMTDTGRSFKAVYLSSFEPAPRKEFALYTRRDLEPIKIDHISPTIASLRAVWNDLPHLWLYAEADENELIDPEAMRQVAARALAKSILAVQ